MAVMSSETVMRRAGLGEELDLFSPVVTGMGGVGGIADSQTLTLSIGSLALDQVADVNRRRRGGGNSGSLFGTFFS